MLGKAEIEAILPHRDPFLLVDEVIELVPGERVVARQARSPTRTAPATFPGNPIMPGVKMVEALAQCGAVAVLSQPENRGKLALFAGIDDVRFKRIVRPGDVLDLVCEVEAVRGPVGKGKVRATVGARARRARDADVRGGRMISRANGRPISITGLGCHVPGARGHERRARRVRRHVRRVDPRPDRDPRAPHRRRHRGDVGPLAARLPESAARWRASSRRASTS